MQYNDTEADPAQRPRVLLVDDEPAGLLLSAAVLGERGFDVTPVTDGAEALCLLSDWTPDLIVLDALMPGMDGFELCAAIRGLRGLEFTPVLMLTGLEDQTSIERAYAVGATDFVVKSQPWSLIAGRLRSLLRAARINLELLRSRAKLARAQDLARMGSLDWRAAPRGLRLEPEALRVLGCGPRRAIGLRQLLRMVMAPERPGMAALLREVVRHSTVLDTDASVRTADGRQRVIHIEAEPEFNEQGAVCGYTGILQDVTDRRQIEDKIKRLANFDALTGLPNRRQLIWRAERAIDHASRLGHRCALLLIDLDRFKIVNETLGHGAGDELLLEIGRRLRSCVRHSDQLADMSIDAMLLRSHRSLEAIGRLGGDEFVALLPEVFDVAEAEQAAQRILLALRAPVVLSGAEYFVTASIGMAVYPGHGVTVVDLLRNADAAMYAAKSWGRNQAQVYQTSMQGAGRDQLELESALHKALERGELVLHYQPKVDVLQRRVVGVEALMRWRRNGELVQPDDFIPLAEATGLILPMSEWAIRETARQIRLWRDTEGLDLKVAVNLPSRCFERADMLEHLRDAVAAHDVPLSSIELEITETSLMKGLQSVMPVLHRLTKSGVGLSIDDFGTGYSSLSYLTQLPIGELKIDRSFICVLGTPGHMSAVVTTIIALAQTLGLKLVAEGVENQVQCETLSRLGCSVMQGFLFARPMPPEEIGRWVRQYQDEGVAADPLALVAFALPGAVVVPDPQPATASA